MRPSLRYEDLPEDVIRIAKRTILDTLGCAFGGYSAGPSKIAMKLASDVNSKQPGTILLSGIKTSPELAVFANGVMIRYLDFNDAYVSQMNGAGHPERYDCGVADRGRTKVSEAVGISSPQPSSLMRSTARLGMCLITWAMASTIRRSPAWGPW